MSVELKEGGLYRIIKPIRMYYSRFDTSDSHTMVGDKIIVKGRYNAHNSVLWVVLTTDGRTIVVPRNVLELGLEEI